MRRTTRRKEEEVTLRSPRNITAVKDLADGGFDAGAASDGVYDSAASFPLAFQRKSTRSPVWQRRRGRAADGAAVAEADRNYPHHHLHQHTTVATTEALLLLATVDDLDVESQHQRRSAGDGDGGNDGGQATGRAGGARPKTTLVNETFNSGSNQKKKKVRVMGEGEEFETVPLNRG